MSYERFWIAEMYLVIYTTFYAMRQLATISFDQRISFFVLLILYSYQTALVEAILCKKNVYLALFFLSSIIIILVLVSFFTPALADGADGLSLESERQQVSSGRQDSSLHSCQSQQCCCLDDPQ